MSTKAKLPKSQKAEPPKNTPETGRLVAYAGVYFSRAKNSKSLELQESQVKASNKIAKATKTMNTRKALHGPSAVPPETREQNELPEPKMSKATRETRQQSNGNAR